MLAVLVSHTFGSIIQPWEHMFTVGPFVFFPMAIVTNGQHGVSLFFMLSGFVLALPYCLGRRTMQSAKDVYRYYVRRWNRIAPLYIVVSIAGLLIFPPTNKWVVFFLYATSGFIFTQEYFFPHENGILWLLGVEIWLSILLPFVLFFRSQRARVYLTIGSIVLALGVTYYCAYHVWLDPLTTGVPMRLCTFLLGVVLADRYAKKRTPIPASFLIGCVLLFFFFQMTSFSESILRISHINMPIRLAVYPSIIPGVSIGLFLCIDSLLYRAHTWLRAFLESWLLQMIGLMCYSMYVWHLMIFDAMQPMESALRFMTYLVVVGVVSWLSYAHIEFRSVRDIRMLFPVKGSGR